MAVGCGWQAFVAYVNVGCYYVVGIPLGILLGFTFDFGAKVYFKFLKKKIEDFRILTPLEIFYLRSTNMFNIDS